LKSEQKNGVTGMERARIIRKKVNTDINFLGQRYIKNPAKNGV
jgi:hypothetical protein